jgi:hypothetical protein
MWSMLFNMDCNTMANMSYCRFQNTVGDLEDCIRNLRTLDPNDHSQNNRVELESRARLIQAAVMLLEDIGLIDLDNHDVDGAISTLEYEPEDE